MNVVVAVVTAACDDKLSEAKVVEFHGKVCMCLEEVIYEVKNLLIYFMFVRVCSL